MYAFNKIAGDKVKDMFVKSVVMTKSTQVSLWRGLKDVRSSQCKGVQWDHDLPKVREAPCWKPLCVCVHCPLGEGEGGGKVTLR